MGELIQFETALLAKEKGLDLESNYFREQEEGKPDYDDSCENWNLYDGYCTIVTQSSLQKWLREKHKLFICIKHRITGSIEEPLVEFTYNRNNGERNNIYYDTHEKALEKALFECLEMIPETFS